MSQTACISQYYQELLQIGFSTTVLPVNDEGGGDWTVKASRPFFPLSGYKATPGLAPMVDNQNFRDTFSGLINDCYTASVNKVGGIVSAPTIADGTFDQYLYKKLAPSPFNLNRYNTQRDELLDFWANIDLGNTGQEYRQALDKFAERVKSQFDKQLFVAPGDYRFSNLSGTFAAMWELWLAADQDLSGILVLEIQSI